ncbi:hypothetical protein KR018_009562 [Drosophila ironensis]|nr:hypothetical protein KR018_009562 [Drosophila ironensis]
MWNTLGGFGQPLWPGDSNPFGIVDPPRPKIELPRELTPAGPFGTQHSNAGIVTGASVLGIRYDEGVMVSADTLVSYGNMARFQTIDRVFKVNKNIVLGGSGDFADVQALKRNIEQKTIQDYCHNDNIMLKPRALARWMTRLLYNRRSRMRPLLVDLVVGGVGVGGEPYLANVDMRGRAFDDFVVATGFARHLALPVVRDAKPPHREFTYQECSDTIHKCMELLYYRDTRNNAQYTVGICSTKKCDIEGPFEVAQNWTYANNIKGY